MPGEERSSLLFSSNVNFPQKYICVGKIRFTMDMFANESSAESSQPVYETMLFDNDGGGTVKAIQMKDISDAVTVELPVSIAVDSSTCFMWNDKSWSSNDCTKQKTNSTDRIVCKCRTSGRVSIVMK
jgi:hypothetical protein